MQNRSLYHYQKAGNLDPYDTELLGRLRRLAGQDYLVLEPPDAE
jgi:hypothetical protein